VTLKGYMGRGEPFSVSPELEGGPKRNLRTMPSRDDLELDSPMSTWLQELADLDAAESAGAAQDDRLLGSTVNRLKAELDALAMKLRQPPPLDPYEQESAFRHALGLVEAMGGTSSPASIQSPEHAPPDQLGFLGQYELLCVLGRGAMGTVYKARHSKLDKIVAVKVLDIGRLRDERAVARFEREMKAIASAEHPHIVRATDAGESEGRHFLVMEYVAGLDLSRLLSNVGPLPAAEACELIRQAALGLHYAHSKGLVHRDLKPSNLMLASNEDGSPQVKILDMGLALLRTPRASEGRELTANGQVMGTFDYMAPEQATDSHKVDIRADIYSLGATLYKLLCGRPPLAGHEEDSPVKRLMTMANETPLPIVQRRSDLPEDLPAVVDRMLARNPDERYATPAEVAAALTPFCVACDLTALLRKADAVQPLARRDTLLPTTLQCGPGSSTEKAASKECTGNARRARPVNARFHFPSGRWRLLRLFGGALGLLAALAAVWVIRIEMENRKSGLKRGAEVPLQTPRSTDGGPTDKTAVPDGQVPPLAEVPFDPAQALAHQQAWARHLGSEIEISNSIGMRFRLIPPGEFMMGSFDHEPAYTADQGPRHRVRITRAFYLGVFEVTQGEYTRVMGSNPSYYSSGGEGEKKGVGSFTARHPVNAVSWLDAVGFCNKLSELEQLQPCYSIAVAMVTTIAGSGYRLPTEAEWEYACRSGSAGMYCFWDNTQLDEYAWHKATCEGLHPVGQKLANGFGLYDVHGSVLEWCADWWAADYYANSPVDDPPGPDTGESRALHGGSWRNGHPPHLRCARRSHYAPDVSYDYTGFRVARTVPFEVRSGHLDARAEKARQE